MIQFLSCVSCYLEEFIMHLKMSKWSVWFVSFIDVSPENR